MQGRRWSSGLACCAAALLQRGLLVEVGLSILRELDKFAEPFQQIGKTLAVFFAHGGEFQSQTTAGLNMPHHSFGFDLSFLDKKMEVGLRAHGPGHAREDEQTTGSQIVNL